MLPQAAKRTTEAVEHDAVDGYVYLMLARLQSGKRYKIGRTESVPRRHRQIALEMPEKPDVVHVIATDDPAGIEAYWHNRFASKRYERRMVRPDSDRRTSIQAPQVRVAG